MIQIKLIKYLANGKCEARFETRILSGPAKGARVKHYVYRVVEIDGTVVFRHVQHWLVPATVPAHYDAYHGFFISERVFWGKYRGAELRNGFAADTWKAIAGSVEKIQELEK